MSQHMIGWTRSRCSWKISHHRMTTPKLSISHVSPNSIIWLMGYYFDEAPTGWWWSVALDKKALNRSGIFTATYADHTHHGVRSSGKASDVVSTNPQPRMMWWRSSPSAGITSFFRSKLQSMQILFDQSISLGLSPSRESTSLVFCPGHQEDSDSYLSP
jgi:hypothetical protein